MSESKSWIRFDMLVLIISIALAIYSRQIFLIIPAVGFLIFTLLGGDPYKKLSIFESPSSHSNKVGGVKK